MIANLGCDPSAYPDREYRSLHVPAPDALHLPPAPASRRTVGMDVFVESEAASEVLGRSLGQAVEGLPLRLKMLSNRGTVVYPATGGSTDCVDHWRCRFVLRDGAQEMDREMVFGLLERVEARHHWNHVETLYEFDGEPSYTRAQGEN